MLLRHQIEQDTSFSPGQYEYANVTLSVSLETALLLQRWKDDYLRWSPADWGGIRSVKFSPWQIWKPDIMLYNT